MQQNMPIHTYYAIGTYSVSLNATNSVGSDTTYKTNYITVFEALRSSRIGVVRNNNLWLLDASGNGAFGAGDYAYAFGKTGDVFVTGDWNGDGKTEIECSGRTTCGYWMRPGTVRSEPGIMPIPSARPGM